MRSEDPRRKVARRTQIESLEHRMVMSADPIGGLLGGAIQHHALRDDSSASDAVPTLEQHQSISDHRSVDQHGVHGGYDQNADFWIDPSRERDLESELDRIEQSLASAHDQSGLTQVNQNYGFTGGGQTVAVIDSGIAWDHVALGSGLGASYRVVGGWDFAEDDADPYDDGPTGSHGTHVAGIVGSDAGSNAGVAPDVDLVGLRVFDDAGNGYFNWVETALQWVHDNRDSLANPITAVNLSLGTSWNSDTVPSWAMLEDEFAALNADGIFVAVSAGNSFTDYNAPGLSYPAASEYVVPVMATDDNGQLSYFSQRHSRGIAAPGRYIVSTVPDYVGNNNNVTDDYASFSGTSMAAPYVAGASVLVREAMQFYDTHANITQDTIFNHMASTADSFYDAATGQTYDRLNLDAAISALEPTDDYGSTVNAATDLGALSGSISVNGLIGNLNDADYFSFTADATGDVTFSSVATHDLGITWDGEGILGTQGETFTLEVVAGQSYTFGLSTSDGLGYYSLTISTDGAPAVASATAFQQAFDVDQAVNLQYTGSYYRDWGGMDEKWLKDDSGAWYFITPDGALHTWDSGAGMAGSEVIASLSRTHYRHTDLLFEAPDPAGTPQNLATQIDARLDLGSSGNYFENWGGLGEKWITAGDGAWYFLTPSGGLFEWSGEQELTSSTLLAEFESSHHADPRALYQAADPTSLPELAYQLDQSLGLQYNGSYFDNWGGQNEKWITGDAASWFFLTQDGSFYRWTGQSNLLDSSLLATFNASYYADPSLLHDAAPPASSSSISTAQSVVRQDVSLGWLGSVGTSESAGVAAQDRGNVADEAMNSFTADDNAELLLASRADAIDVAAVTLVAEADRSDAASELSDRLFEELDDADDWSRASALVDSLSVNLQGD